MHAHPHPLQVSHVCVSIPCTHPHPSHSQVQRLLPTNPMKHLSPIRHTSNEGKDCVTSFRPASSLDNSPLLPLTTTPIYTCAYIRFRTLVRKISPRADALCHNGCRSRFHCQPRCLPPPLPPRRVPPGWRKAEPAPVPPINNSYVLFCGRAFNWSCYILH